MYKKARQSIQSGQPDEQTLKEAVSFLDKAANKGIIHKNNAARRKARLMKFYHSSLEEAEA
jgi:small subunit ribosomal protein S20